MDIAIDTSLMEKTEVNHIYINQEIDSFIIRYETSELRYEIKNLIIHVLKKIDHLIFGNKDLELFFVNLPDIINQIPCKIENTPFGVEYYYDLDFLKNCIKNSSDLASFIKIYQSNGKG